MMMQWLLVALGGFFGAIGRYAVGRWFAARHPSPFPFGTLTVNWLGSFLLGLLVGSRLPAEWLLLLGTGFMGAFTTFSTFKVESLQLGRNRNWRQLVLYLAASYTGGIMLALLGFALAEA